MYGFLLTRRWLGIWAALVVVLPSFAALGMWQLDRFEQRRAANTLVEHNLVAEPVPIEQLVRAGGGVSPSDQWRRVSAAGEYQPADQRLVRRRANQGRPGFHVLTPLITESGTAVLVNRGWIPAGQTALDTPAAPPPPAGTVAVVGRIRPAQRQRGADPPAGQITQIDTTRLAAELGYPLYAGYIELIGEEPRVPTAPVPPPQPSYSTGPHLAYGVQWFLFAIGAVIGIGYLAHREAAELRAAAVTATPPPPSRS